MTHSTVKILIASNSSFNDFQTFTWNRKKSLNKQTVTYNIIHLMLYLNKERLMVHYQVAIKEEGTYSLTFSRLHHDFECLQANPKGPCLKCTLPRSGLAVCMLCKSDYLSSIPGTHLKVGCTVKMSVTPATP